MKAILSFELPEEREEFEMCSHAGDYYQQLYNIDQLCRDKLKHCDLSDKEEAVYEAIRNMIDIWG